VLASANLHALEAEAMLLARMEVVAVELPDDPFSMGHVAGVDVGVLRRDTRPQRGGERCDGAGSDLHAFTAAALFKNTSFCEFLPPLAEGALARTPTFPLVGGRRLAGIKRRLQLLFLFVRQRGLDDLAAAALNLGQYLVRRRFAHQHEEQ